MTDRQTKNYESPVIFIIDDDGGDDDDVKGISLTHLIF